MAGGDAIDEEWLPQPRGRAGAPARVARAAAATRPRRWPTGMLHIPLGTPLAEVERQVILATYAHCGHHKERTAATLGISMKTLYNRLKEYGD